MITLYSVILVKFQVFNRFFFLISFIVFVLSGYCFDIWQKNGSSLLMQWYFRAAGTTLQNRPYGHASGLHHPRPSGQTGMLAWRKCFYHQHQKEQRNHKLLCLLSSPHFFLHSFFAFCLSIAFLKATFLSCFWMCCVVRLWLLAIATRRCDPPLGLYVGKMNPIIISQWWTWFDVRIRC